MNLLSTSNEKKKKKIFKSKHLRLNFKKLLLCSVAICGVGMSVSGAHPTAVRATSMEVSPNLIIAKADKGTNPDKTLGDSKSVFDWLQRAVNILSGITGLVILISLIVAGIQYTTARDNASQAAAARDRIRDLALIVIPLYVFGYALLQWLIPGGVFN